MSVGPSLANGAASVRMAAKPRPRTAASPWYSPTRFCLGQRGRCEGRWGRRRGSLARMCRDRASWRTRHRRSVRRPRDDRCGGHTTSSRSCRAYRPLSWARTRMRLCPATRRRSRSVRRPLNARRRPRRRRPSYPLQPWRRWFRRGRPPRSGTAVAEAPRPCRRSTSGSGSLRIAHGGRPRPSPVR